MFEEQFLKKFYSKYLEWVADGCPDTNPYGFEKPQALCWLLFAFARKFGLDGQSCMDQLREEFKAAGLDVAYPFDDGDCKKFIFSQQNLTLHDNPKRIKWATDHAL